MPGGFINGGFNIGRTMFPVPFGSRFSPAARDYFARLDAAGLRVSIYDDANAALIDRLVGNGGNFWPASGAFCAMAGYLYPGNGANLIPLKDGHDAGTLNAFVTGDWNAVTGLKGDGSTKYVDSNRAGNDDGLDNIAVGIHLSEARISGAAYIDIDSTTTFFSTNSAQVNVRINTIPASNVISSFTPQSGYLAASRGSSSSIDVRRNGTTDNFSQNSVAASASTWLPFGTTTSNFRSPFYHIGPNLSGAGELAELDAALTEWKNALAAA